jgi:medium-chain acyl-[acyl-carrier-protein] hydrolase
MERMLDWVEATHADALAQPHMLFGHSMGGNIAYALSQRRAKRGAPLARAIFVSACAPPNSPKSHPLHMLPTDQLRNALRNYDPMGFPFDRNPDLWDIFEPIIRADFQLVETYAPQPGKIPIPLCAFSGVDDVIVPAQIIDGWRDAAGGLFAHHSLPGDHFFLRDHIEQIVKVVDNFGR